MPSPWKPQRVHPIKVVSESTAPEAKGENRRRACRIDDEVILQYEMIPTDDGIGGDWPPPRDGPPAFLICSHLAEYRQQMQPLLREIQKETQSTFKYLKLLEEKVDMLANVLLLNELDAISGSKCRVKLSATGVAFHTDGQLPENQLLMVRIVLIPSFTGIISTAQVIRSTRYLGEQRRRFLTTVEFVNMRESTRALIAKHILDRQRDRARRAKDSAATSDRP
jgi:hypothetical protein